MIISEIIEHLERLKSYHGDVEVLLADGACTVVHLNKCDFQSSETQNYLTCGLVEGRHIVVSM